jgi:hypothetical protein
MGFLTLPSKNRQEGFLIPLFILLSKHRLQKETSMKIMISILAFAMTLALSMKSLAADAEHGAEHSAGHSDEHAIVAEKMNALFPPKESNPAKRAIPAKPELIAPTYFSAIKTDKANLQWKAVEGADLYHVQVATDPNFKWLIANDQAVKTTNFEVTGLEAGKHYFWRVLAVKSDNWNTFRKSYFAMSMFETPAAK